MWELDHKEGWARKNWCFWAVVLEKTLESPLDCKEIKPVNPRGNQSWIFTGRTEAVAPILWPPDAKSLTLWKRPWCWERLRAREEGNDRGWDGWIDHRINGHEFEQILGDGEGQESLVCCSPWGHKELDTTEQLNYPGGSEVKASACSFLRPGFNPWVEKIPWRRKQQPTPVFLPWESHGWRSLVGYSPWGHKELDTTERLQFHFQGISFSSPNSWWTIASIPSFSSCISED